MAADDIIHIRDAVTKEFTAAGYSDEQIKAVLDQQDVLRHDETKSEREGKEGATWIKVHRRHLLPDTLVAYRLPWDWDEVSKRPHLVAIWFTIFGKLLKPEYSWTVTI
ncbi:hypothetical protein BDV09DRAFT_179028 [Aspergillus tetrazonus]